MQASEAPAENSPETDVNPATATPALVSWLLTKGCDAPSMHRFVRGYAQELRSLGMPVDRMFLAAVVLHSLVSSRAWKWMVDGDDITDLSWSRSEHREFQEEQKRVAASEIGKRMKHSPMYQMMMGATSISIGVSDENLPEDCDWMPKEGFTELFGLNADATGGDWVVLAENGSRRQNQVTDALNGGFTWSTKRAGGFTDNHRQVLEESRQALVVVMRLLIGRITTQALLQTYLGEDAGTRVYRGDIERGEGLTIRAALWFSDVRGFTKMSGELPRKDLVDVLNSVFEVTQHVIRKYQGQVLKFMGDGCMAIFNGDNVEFQRTSYSSLQKEDMDIEQGATVCHRARLAAAELEVELCKLRIEREEKGLRAASVGVGLHYGDVSYGNVGAADRLDFTVLGSSVNLASRTEGLCSKLEAKVLATGDFVKLDGDPEAWKSRGEHVVKGVAAPVPIYELVEETCNSE